MAKAKYLVFLSLALCVLFMSGGCGGSSHSDLMAVPEGVNAAWTGEWTASQGTASAHAESVDRTLNVQNITALFYSCDVEDTEGTARMSALVILSGDMYMPMFFQDLELSTDRTGEYSWTAQTPHGTLYISLESEDRADFSGTINYLGYECEFNASVSKVKQSTTSFSLENMLDGTWRYDESRAGGYRYSNGSMTALIPRYISMCFNDTTSSSTLTTSAGYIEMPLLTGESYDADDSMFFQFVNTEEPCTLQRFYGDLYAMNSAASAGGISTLFLMQSPTQMFMLMSWVQPDGQLCILLPMTKVQESEESNIAGMLSRNWSATRGGGVMTPSANTSMRVNLRLESCDLTFTDVEISDGSGTAGISATGTFTSDIRTVNLDYDGLTITLEELGINLWRAVSEKGSKIYVSLLSDNTASVIADIVYDGAEKCLLTAVLAPSE